MRDLRDGPAVLLIDVLKLYLSNAKSSTVLRISSTGRGVIHFYSVSFLTHVITIVFCRFINTHGLLCECLIRKPDSLSRNVSQEMDCGARAG